MNWVHKTLAATGLITLVTVGIPGRTAHAANVLLNGGLEDSVGPPFWTLTQSIGGGPPPGDYNDNGAVDAADYVVWRNGGPLLNEVQDVSPDQVTQEDYDAWRERFGNSAGGDPVSAVEHVDLANHPMPATGQLGLLLKPQAGNEGEYRNQNRPVNVILTQTYPFASAAGRTYTFSGHSYYQTAASNNVEFLFDDAPNGPEPSPTQTYFQMEFLDASDAVLDSERLDLPKDRTDDTLPDAWQMHSLMGTAPAGTTKIRLTAAALDMVASCTTGCPAGQDVYFDNFSLRDSVVPTLERLQSTNGNLDTPGAPAHWTLEKTPEDNVQFSSGAFARHTGSVGMWLRSFAGGDAAILQTVPGTPGGNYTFGAWSKWEPNYSGGEEGSTTETFLKMEFLDAASAVIGTPAMLDLRTVQVIPPDDQWRQFFLSAVAPAGTASVRVSAGANGMAATSGRQSAMFDDFSLELAGAGTGNLLASAVPEPSSLILVLSVLLASGCGRHRSVTTR